MKKDWLISPYAGTDATYTLTTDSYHGVYVCNTDNTNSVYFTITALGETELKANQQYRENFKVPFTTVSIRNPNGCKFIVGRVE